jgi:hypothetical protein
MNLGQKTLLVVSLTVAGAMTVLYAVSRDVLLRSYLALEQEQTRSAVSRTEAALNDEISNLARTTNDYGAWDRTYAFMQSPTRGYIKQEFENDTLEGLHVNSVMLADTSQKIVFFKAYDSVDNVEVRVPIEIQKTLSTDSWVLRATATSTPAQGILLLPQGAVLIAACPKYRKILGTNPGAILALELEHLGCTHPQVGAYLMSIWGLPIHLVHAVAFHHSPSETGETQFSSLTAVHVADAIASAIDPSTLNQDIEMDLNYLDCLKLRARETLWRSFHEEYLAAKAQRESVEKKGADCR